MALDYAAISALKTLIKQHCPAADYFATVPGAAEYKTEFSANPGKFQSCHNDGNPWQ